MSICLNSFCPNLLSSPIQLRAATSSSIFHRTQLSNFAIHNRHFLRGNLVVTRFGLGQAPFPDPDDAEFMIRDLFGRVEGFLYTVADAAISNSSDTVAGEVTKQNNDWLSGITNSMETVLKFLKDGLSTLHVPYAYGFAIILLTIIVKAATFPLTKKQVESAMSMQTLTPQIKAIQERYAGDKERIQLETARIYKLAGINPLAGCLPTLATIPIWIGLYRALSNVADEGLLTEGFFWIPSLSGPTTVAARQMGSGTSWLFPFIDGHPPLGWSDTLAYLVLPVLLIISQYISIEIMQPPQSNDPNLKSSQAITKLLPLMIGYFALSVPSGLSLYWLTNNILSTTQQVWLRKLGGAKIPVKQLKDDILKNDISQVVNPITEATEAKVVKKEEKLTPEGPRPGERFKLLKEQEARRRQQREEEKRKAEEAETKAIHIANGEANKENASLETDKSFHVTSFGDNSVISERNSLKNDEFESNDTSDHAESKEKEEISDISNDNENGRSNRNLFENIEKD